MHQLNRASRNSYKSPITVCSVIVTVFNNKKRLGKLSSFEPFLSNTVVNQISKDCIRPISDYVISNIHGFLVRCVYFLVHFLEKTNIIS